MTNLLPHLAGHVLAREHVLVRGMDDRGRVWGVACDAAGKPLVGAVPEVLDVEAWPRLAGLVERVERGGKS